MRQQSTTDKTTQNGFEGIKRSEEEEKKRKTRSLSFCMICAVRTFGIKSTETYNDVVQGEF